MYTVQYIINYLDQSTIDTGKENRIYIRGEFTRKKSRTAILLYCFHTAGVYFTYLCYITFWALVYHFIEKLKLILKENQIIK